MPKAITSISLEQEDSIPVDYIPVGLSNGQRRRMTSSRSSVVQANIGVLSLWCAAAVPLPTSLSKDVDMKAIGNMQMHRLLPTVISHRGGRELFGSFPSTAAAEIQAKAPTVSYIRSTGNSKILVQTVYKYTICRCDLNLRVQTSLIDFAVKLR